MSGIFRPVYLYSTAAARIRDFTARTDLDADYRDATLQIKPELVGERTSSLSNWTVRGAPFRRAERKPVLLFPSLPLTLPSPRWGGGQRPGEGKPFKAPAGNFQISHDAAEILNPDFSAKILDVRMPQRGEPKFAWLDAKVKNPREMDS